MKKRILSIVLAVLMLVSVLPISALAAEESVVPQNVVTAEHGGVKVEKRAEWTDEENGKAKITFTLTGGTMTSQDIPVTDIVLVIDKSASMSKNGSPKMNNAKKAAVSFVNKFFGTGADQGYKDKVRIAVVSYSGSADTVVGLTNKINDLTSGINNIRADGGTHIQAGIYRAQQILDADTREKVKKLIVVLSDGEPTYSYAFTATGTFTGCTKTEWWESCNARLTSHGAFTADYTKRLGAGTRFSGMETDNGIFSWNWENSGNAYVSGTCNKNHDRTQYGAYAVNGTFTANGSSNHGVGTIWEANQAKAKGTEIFAVGFGLGADDTNAINTMKGVATDDDHYKAATTADISYIFNTIADTITKAIAKDATLTDPLGTGFTLTTTEGGKTYTQDVGELDTESKTITFDIQYDTANPAAGDTLPTNNGATLTYTDADGKPQIIHIGNPELENLARTVTYVDEDGNAYTDPEHAAKPYWKGTEVTQAAAPTKQGYTFTGWEKTQGDVEVADGKFTIGSDNVTFKATWTKNTKTLTITKTWEGTTEKPTVTFQLLQARKGEENAAVYQTFELDGIVDTEGEVVETAPWTATIEVPVKDTDGTEFKYSVKETKIGGTSIGAGAFNVTGTNPDNTSYIIGTWSVNSSGRPPEGTWTFTNKYTPKTPHTLTYEFVGEDKPEGANAPAAESLYKDQQTHLAEVNAPDGWSFDGWYTDAGCTEGNKVTSPYTMPGSNMTLYGKWEQKQPDVLVTKRATYTRDGVDMGSLPYDTGNKNEMGTVQVDDVINYTVTITNTGTTTFGNADYAWDSFTSPSGNPLLEHTSGTSQIKSGDKEQIKLAGLEPTKSVTKYYRYVVTENDATGTKRIANNVWAYVHIDPTDSHSETLPNRYSAVNVNVVKPEPKTATLRFEFKSGMDGKDLPAGMPTAPSNVTEEVGTAVQLTNYTETVNDEGNKGKWTFVGWYTDDNLSAESKITGDTYPMPEGGKTLYGKWTFEADKPEITEAGYTVEYYRQNADGENYTLQEDTDSGVAEIGKEKTIEPAEDKYSGYTYNETKSIVTLTIQEEAGKNVFKVYYDAVPGLTVTKTITDVTRDGEPLDPTDPEVEVKEGDVIEYEITVKNSGKLNLTDVVLTDEFTGAEGDLTFISGDDYTVDGYEITLKNDLNVGDSVTIKATYEVQLGDSGYEITNKASGTAKDALGGDVTGESRLVRITPDALKAYRIFGSAYKYVKSEKGTFNKDGETVTFEFKVTSDKKGEEILDTFTIDVDETVKAGETSEGDWGGFDFNLSEEEFENLDKKEFNGKEYPVVYLWELKGDLKNMSYSTKRITLYLDRPNISYYSAREPMVEYLGTWMAYADPDKGADADIINIYGKQSSSGGTVKVGPQLNRDDHVAYIMGYPDGTVQPEGEITRAEACTIFFRLLTESSRNYYFSKTNDYTDVNAGDWFNNAISTLSNAGIVTGYNDGTFRPNQPITRGEMAKIIANFANLNKGTKSFTDLSGHWSKSYVELAAGNGWIAGYPDGSFRPDQKITRAETVTMINRVLERVPAKELRLLSRSIMLTFPDNNPGDWYYIAIQEASNSHEYQRSVYETTGDEMWTKLIDNVDWTKLEK